MSDNDDLAAQIVQHAVDENPAEMGDAVKNALGNKTREFINTTRKEVASNYFDGQQDLGDNDD